MKKTLLLCCAAALTAGASAAVKTDVLDLETIETLATLEDVQLDEYEGYLQGSTFNLDGSFTDSGVTYKIGRVFKNGENIKFGYQGFLATEENPDGLYVQSVKVVLADPENVYSQSYLYTRDTKVTYKDGYGGLQPEVGYNYDTYNEYPGNTKIEPESWGQQGGSTFKVEGPYTHMVLQPVDNPIIRIEVTWDTSAPVAQVKTPDIMFGQDATGNYPSPLSVRFQCQTPGSTACYTVTRNGEAYLNGELVLTDDYNADVITVEGQPDDVIAVTLVCKKDGFKDSDEVTKSVTLTLPGLSAPAGDLFGYGWFEAVTGRPYVITNPNGVGTLHYAVNGGEETTTDEAQVSLTVPGKPGDEFTVSAWITADGYIASQTKEFNAVVYTNVLATPYFSLDDGEVRPNTTITANSNDSWRGGQFKYRVNDGEWVLTENTESVRVPVEGSLKLEVQLLAATEGDNTYFVDSEIAEGNWTVEPVDPEYHYAVSPYDFFEANEGEEKYCYFYSMNGQTIKGTVNGVEFEHLGNCYHNWNYSENCYQTPYFYWSGANSTHMFRNNDAINGIAKVKFDFEGSNDPLNLYFSDSHIADVQNLPSDCQEVYLNGDEADGKWLDLAAYDQANGTSASGKKYFALVPGNQNVYPNIQRLMLEKEGYVSGIAEMGTATEGATRYYGLDGVEVSADKLAGGIYVKVQNGKASKVAVK